ncbi:hypothetical protein WJX73_000121 [Symbiochloris irregularis]|uniref:Tubulin-specific chaperone A n=1 Tax=Symbiochloris irregularis TaxID=706552 RepID=A0AAW1NR33_9CHLO
MSNQEARQLKIKTGSVVRLKKELALYLKERDSEQQRVNALKQGQADKHDIKHAEDVLAEASMIVPDTRQRLEAAVKDLAKLLEELKESPGVAGSQEQQTAAQAKLEAEQLITSSA